MREVPRAVKAVTSSGVLLIFLSLFFFFVAFVLPKLLIYTHIFFHLKLTTDLLSCRLTCFVGIDIHAEPDEFYCKGFSKKKRRRKF